MHKLICNRSNCYDFLLCDTRKVVIECTSVYDILSSFSYICCLIYNCRRISCASADSTFSRGKDCCYNARTACCCDKRDIFMFHHNIACL